MIIYLWFESRLGGVIFMANMIAEVAVLKSNLFSSEQPRAEQLSPWKGTRLFFTTQALLEYALFRAGRLAWRNTFIP
jgi:hypothetical protein